MKSLLVLSALLTTSAFAKITTKDHKFFVESKGNRHPISMLNSLVEKKAISAVKLYANGNVHMLSFAKNGEKEKVYSVDEQGYMYSIKPFTDYQVSKVSSDGKVKFKQDTKRSYKVNPKGFFLY